MRRLLTTRRGPTIALGIGILFLGGSWIARGVIPAAPGEGPPVVTEALTYVGGLFLFIWMALTFLQRYRRYRGKNKGIGWEKDEGRDEEVKRKLPRKQGMVLGGVIAVVIGLVIIVLGIVTGLWFNIFIGLALIVWTMFRGFRFLRSG